MLFRKVIWTWWIIWWRLYGSQLNTSRMKTKISFLCDLLVWRHILRLVSLNLGQMSSQTNGIQSNKKEPGWCAVFRTIWVFIEFTSNWLEIYCSRYWIKSVQSNVKCLAWMKFILFGWSELEKCVPLRKLLLAETFNHAYILFWMMLRLGNWARLGIVYCNLNRLQFNNSRVSTRCNFFVSKQKTSVYSRQTRPIHEFHWKIAFQTIRLKFDMWWERSHFIWNRVICGTVMSLHENLIMSHRLYKPIKGLIKSIFRSGSV